MTICVLDRPASTPIPKVRDIDQIVREILREKYVDAHVHCRDGERERERKKSTISEVMRLVRSNGGVAIVDKPNTYPPITTLERVESRLRLAEQEGCLDGYYISVGVTADPEQVKGAARIAMTHPKVVSMKMFAGRSVGDLAVIRDEDQRMVYRALAEMRYDGILEVHCEYEGLMRPELWVPERPATWNLARPEEAEVKSAMNQIEFARSEGFVGHLHICHVSTPKTVMLVKEAWAYMRISCGITPHHWLYSTDDMQTVKGMAYKVNPPIRDRKTMLGLRECLRQGEIDMIYTDHAPHTIEEKTYGPGKPKDFYMSGIRSEEDFPAFIRALVNDGLGAEQISGLIRSNPKRIFTKIAE